jgi:hypothetical protein
MKKSITISIILSLFLFTSACKKETLCTCNKTTKKWYVDKNNKVIIEEPVNTSTSIIMDGEGSAVAAECEKKSVYPEVNTTTKWIKVKDTISRVPFLTIIESDKPVAGNSIEVQCSITER